MKRIALFGGSFNPPHPGHFDMARHIHDTLKVDEVWFLYSTNPFKDPAAYASTTQRIEMSELLARFYPDLPFVACDVEEELGTHVTYNILTKLQALHPDNKFIWVMGADNLAEFHKWGNYEKIIENFPIAVVDRPGYTSKAIESITALTYAHLKSEAPEELAQQENGWSFLSSIGSFSSSNLLREIHSGKTDFGGPFQVVADYIARHELYKINPERNIAPVSAPRLA